jgi:hypothetical protein
MYRIRNNWQNIDRSDPVVQGIALVALALLIIIAIPWLQPGWVTSGGVCTDIASPRISGSNQSLLGNSVDPDVLRLEIVPNPIQALPGDALRYDVRFINDSMAPLNLWLVQNQFVFRYTGQEDGLAFLIQSVDGRVLGEPTNVRAPQIAPQQYAAAELHVLRPRSRCTMPITVDPNRLAAAGVGGGQYRLVAVYTNRSKGAISPVQRLTPTPIFTDQGVWTGQVRSQDVTIVIAAPAAAQ